MLLDHRRDDLAFVYCKDKSGSLDWHKIPVVLDDVTRDEYDKQEYDEDKDPFEEEWTLEDFGYTFDASEIVLHPDSTVRIFHVCVAHPVARAVVANKIIEHDFSCPAHSQACPIQTFVSKHKFKQAHLLHMNSENQRSLWLCH